MTDPQPLLSARGLTRRFAGPHGGVLAVDAVDLDLFAGRVHALLGENGAGKSTLMSLFSGWHRADAGEVRLSGARLAPGSPAAALRAGIGMVHQRFSLVEALSGAENLALAAGGAPDPRGAAELARRFGLALEPMRRVADMGMGERQRLEILKLLARDAKILILDEPTSVLAPSEIGVLTATLRRLAGEGRAVVLISHKLAEIAQAADEVSVLRRGRMVVRNQPRDPALAEGWDLGELSRLMVGRELPKTQPKAGRTLGEPVLHARGLAGPGFADVDLDVARGEVLAIVGVAGNGQEGLAAVLGGMEARAGGELAVLGRRPDRSLVAHVPEDRHGAATVPDMTLAENLLLSTTGLRGAYFSGTAGTRAARAAIAALNVAAAGPTALARELSGGNLQKFILARELGKATPLLVLEQPTQGLDVLAVAEVHAAILKAASGEDASAVVLVTGDPAEALALADRVAVLFRGRIVGVVESAAPEAFKRVGRLMAGLPEFAEAGEARA